MDVISSLSCIFASILYFKSLQDANRDYKQSNMQIYYLSLACCYSHACISCISAIEGNSWNYVDCWYIELGIYYVLKERHAETEEPSNRVPENVGGSAKMSESIKVDIHRVFAVPSNACHEERFLDFYCRSVLKYKILFDFTTQCPWSGHSSFHSAANIDIVGGVLLWSEARVVWAYQHVKTWHHFMLLLK